MGGFSKVLPPTAKPFLHVTGIAQDKLGYVWLATKNGLFRYNGYEMISYKFDPLDKNSLPSDQLETICVDTAGNIWIGSLGTGLFKFDPHRQQFTKYQHIEGDPNSIRSNWISVVFTDTKGNIWVGTGDGLDRFDASFGSFVHYTSVAADSTTLSSNEVVSIYEDRQGTLWVGTGSIYGNNKFNESVGGLNRMDSITGKFTRFVHNASDANSLISNKVRALYESRDGTFWVGTAGDGLHTMDRKTGKFTRHTYDPKQPGKLSRPQRSPEPFAMISFITEDAKNGLWIGTTDNGITYHDPITKRTAHVFPSAEGEGQFGNENPWTAVSSAEGVLWISTIGGSLFTYNPMQVKIPFFRMDAGEITSIYEDGDGTLWLASEKGLLHVDEKKNLIKQYQHDPEDPNSLRTNRIITLAPDNKGDLWLGTLGSGISHFSTKTGKARHFYRNPQNTTSLSNDTVIRVYQDKAGRVWAGTLRGASLLDKQTGTFKRFIPYPADTAGFGKNLVSSILTDKSNQCWIGSFVGGGIHLLNPTTGSLKTYLQGISISNLFQDAAGTLWTGGIEGLFFYDQRIDSFMRFTDPLGLVMIHDVYSIAEDNESNIWLSTTASLIKISKNRDEVFSYDKHFGLNEDMIYGASYKGRSGKLYFPAISGFYELSPSGFNKETRPPQIILSNFRLSNQVVTPGENSPLTTDISATKYIKLNYNQNIFSFDFAAIDFVDPSANRHLFMLENYDRSWNIPGSDRRAIYFNVPPGNYVFRVRAVNAYGKWTERAITIEIVPAWWSQWWFRITVIFAVVALIYFMIRWRLSEKYRLQMERSEQENELSRLQHRTSQLEMHALRAQMNPHFLFNSLNSINRFIIQNNSEQASAYLTKFSRLMRLILQNSQHELIPLENELEALKLYLELEAVRFDHHFSYTVEVDDKLDAGALKVPPLIIQPYAENAIWHGLMHKEEKGKLLIELLEEDDYLVCRITDDGIGRQKAAELKSKSASTHKSMGMKITADRIASMRRRKSNENNIQITDLTLPDGSPGGTRVEIKIALQYD